jgi:hypothetical protein
MALQLQSSPILPLTREGKKIFPNEKITMEEANETKTKTTLRAQLALPWRACTALLVWRREEKKCFSWRTLPFNNRTYDGQKFVQL